MLKFVQGFGHVEPAERVTLSANATSTEHKDVEHNCTVCRTRRRSLERQTANVLRRSRSTLSSADNANTKDIASVNHESGINQNNGPQVEVGAGKERRGSAAKWGKYRRLSRSCEALTTSNKAALLNDVSNCNSDRSQRASHQCKLILLRNGNSLDQDVVTDTAGCVNGEEQNPTNKVPVRSRLCDTLNRQMVAKRDDDRGRKSSPRGSRIGEEGGHKPAGKQVQFGGVEYEKSDDVEGSVMGKLKMAVGIGGRRMRSRSLERIGRRDWDDQRSDKEVPCENMARLSSKTCTVDKKMSQLVKPPRDGVGSVSDQRRYCRRSRSRSRERSDDIVRIEYRTRHDFENHQYICEKNHKVLAHECSPSRHENVTLIKRSTVDNTLSSSGEQTNESPGIRRSSGVRSPLDAKQNGDSILDRKYLKQIRQDSIALISPQYVAPNGHYGTAVIRKCHENQRLANSKQISKICQKIDSLPTDATSNKHKTANLAYKEKVRRNSLPKLEKCGISAQKIAKLDCPLEVRVPECSIMDPPKLNASFEDEATISGHSTDRNGRLDETTESNVKIRQDGDTDMTSGYVYNCATAKITKLDTELLEDVRPTDTDSHLSDLPDLRKIEPANNLVRHASVASLSLISVNSVDSGTSCHDGSTTDSSSASSDKEIEIHGKPCVAFGCQTASRVSSTKHRLGKEARQYTASAKELEQLILSSCFGKDKHGAAQVTSDYESDTGPDGARGSVGVDGRRRKNGMARVVRFVGSKNDNDLRSEIWNDQLPKPKGQSPSSTNRYTANTKHRTHPDNQSAVGQHNLGRMTTQARVQHTHKAMSKAEMSVQCGDVVYLTPEDCDQRPLWVIAYSNKSGQMGLIPSVYLET